MSDCLLALTTCADAETARRIAHMLVDERLAACVNQLPGVTSVYRWRGRTHQDTEILLLIKTSAARLPALRERLAAVHPYEVPELIAMPIVDGLPNYLDWVRESVTDEGA